MRIVFDEIKRRANASKHGYDFRDLQLDFFLEAVVLPAKNNRFKAIGWFGETILTVIFAPLGREAISIVSMRDATEPKGKAYEETCHAAHGRGRSGSSGPHCQ